MCSQKENQFALIENDDKITQTSDGVSTYPIDYALENYNKQNW